MIVKSIRAIRAFIKSLHCCYVNRDALYCDVSINEALMASKISKQGKGIAAIGKAVDKKFSRN